MAYNFKEIESRLQAKWDEEKLYITDITSTKKKEYLLVEFPYPSGAGLHMGHMRSYTAMDIIARKRRAEGYEVLFPIGWDAFGLPAENYAIKTGVHPSISTKENIDNFRKQLKACGFSFDWTKEVDTTDPSYYRWSQWIFLKLYENNLAYKKRMLVNWCPKDKCVLANEEVVDGKCERCGTEATKKDKEQWMLAITKYAERLDKDLDETDYLDKIKIQQRNWIGLSKGSEISFGIQGDDFKSSFAVFTTRADTLFGCTYCVLAPEHPLVEELLAKNLLDNNDIVTKYRDETRQKLDIDRSAEGKEKTGIKLEGVMAINPINKEEVPLFIADYVLPQYGTGAIMAVPAHDQRDFEFAKKYNLEIKEVIAERILLNRDDAARDNVGTLDRNVVDVILENNKGEYLLIIENKKDYHFIGGGIEKGDTVAETIHKETEEESGYTDIKIMSKGIHPVSVFGFRHPKQKNQDTVGFFFHAQLLSDKKIYCESDEGRHEIGWFKKEEIEDLITWSHHKKAWMHFIGKTQGAFTTADGIVVNSGAFDGLTSNEARTKITEAVGGKIVMKSKLRDWVFARQRYWGEPIPIVYNAEGKMYPVSENELPIVLPQIASFLPTDNGESPLSLAPEWVTIKGKINETGHFVSDKNGEPFRRETDTMPQWAGSSWYFMRYIDPKNKRAIANKDLLAKWLPVDWYNGGMEHTTLHLLYSRFWFKFLFDIGLVPISEPYYKRTSQGMILGADGGKMSKSVGNVVSPDDIIKTYGADVLRVYEMFMGPFDQAVAWDDKAIVGVKRFLDKVEVLSTKVNGDVKELTITTHKTIKAIGAGVENMNFNTCVSSLMIWLNLYEKEDIDSNNYKIFLKLLSPFAPYITDEIWRKLGEKESIHSAPWPLFDENKLIDNSVTIGVQIGGKLRGTAVFVLDSDQNSVHAEISTQDYYKKYTEGREPKKIIFVKNKIINYVF